jgi:DNA-binding NarL/FixJ family response regulator
MGVTAQKYEVAPFGRAKVAIAVVAEDNRARRTIAAALGKEPDLSLRFGVSARDLAASPPCDVILRYSRALGSDDLATLAELRRQAPELPIVAVCESADSRSARRAIDVGLDGLVLADQLDTALVPTMRAVMSGQIVTSRALRLDSRNPFLSHREKQVLAMVVMGFTNSEIGARLFVAESTVKSHLSSAFTKLGVRSRSEAAALILDPHGSLGTGILAITDCDKSVGVGKTA